MGSVLDLHFGGDTLCLMVVLIRVLDVVNLYERKRYDWGRGRELFDALSR